LTERRSSRPDALEGSGPRTMDSDQASPSFNGAPKGRRLLLLVFSVALFAAILWFGGMESLRTVLLGDPRLYLLAFAMSGIVAGLSGWRLQTLVRASTGESVAPWRRFFHVNMTAVAMGLFLPRNAALVGGKAGYLRTLGVPLLRGTSGVLMENVVDLVFLGVLVLPSGLVFVAGIGPGGFLIATGVCVVGLLSIALWTRGRNWRGFLASVIERVPMVARRLPTFERGFLPGPVRAVQMLTATVCIHTLLALRAYVIALAIGLDANWLVFVAAYPLAQLGLALAVAPGALGTLDASWLGLLILGGVPRADALSFTVALRACIVVFPIIWYGVSSVLVATVPTEPSAPGATASNSQVEDG